MKTKLITLFMLLFVSISAGAQSIIGTWWSSEDDMDFKFAFNSDGSGEVAMAGEDVEDFDDSDVKLKINFISSVPVKWQKEGNMLFIETNGEGSSNVDYDVICDDAAARALVMQYVKSQEAELKQVLTESLKQVFEDNLMSVNVVKLTDDELTLSIDDEELTFTHNKMTPHQPEPSGVVVSEIGGFEASDLRGNTMSDQRYTAPATSGDEHVYTVVEQPPLFPGGQEALLRYIATHMRYPVSAQEQEIQGVVVLKFVVKADGTVGDVEVVQSLHNRNYPVGKEYWLKHHEGATDKDYQAYVAQVEENNRLGIGTCDGEAVRVVKSLPRFIPGKQQGKPVAVWFTIPIRFQLQ